MPVVGFYYDNSPYKRLHDAWGMVLGHFRLLNVGVAAAVSVGPDGWWLGWQPRQHKGWLLCARKSAADEWKDISESPLQARIACAQAVPELEKLMLENRNATAENATAAASYLEKYLTCPTTTTP